jgi:2-polyprenyl-6-hydroxyphenyl methylase/3-demethylubiquinone-9 3-methyltransferase
MTDDRFTFGANWARFLARLTPERIAVAESSLTEWLGELRGVRFLDIGSGSGLFSLAARNLGARVHSFDYDPESVACTQELRRRYYPTDDAWVAEQGSVLDEGYLKSLGQFDVVYSWGVLHHTGDMWRALELAQIPVAPDGRLFVALYRRQSPVRHRLILAQKRAYVHGGAIRRALLLGSYTAWAVTLESIAALANGQSPVRRLRNSGRRSRGMSFRTDLVDWVGGYPYEAVLPEEVFDFYRTRGWTLERLRSGVGVGCDEFLFRRAVTSRSSLGHGR